MYEAVHASPDGEATVTETFASHRVADHKSRMTITLPAARCVSP